jgi:hypothetical protein
LNNRSWSLIMGDRPDTVESCATNGLEITIFMLLSNSRYSKKWAKKISGPVTVVFCPLHIVAEM